MTLNVCVVTGSRADYGLLRPVLQEIVVTPDLRLSLVVTGSHLSSEFGLTLSEIKKDGFEITRKVEMLLAADSVVAVTKSMGLGILGFADVLNDLAPDMVMVLGDRFEIFAVAAATLTSRSPLAQIHGGETTEGAFDESIRHAITKMSQLHFVAAEKYRTRVIQMGESPLTVFNVGGLGVDNISRMNFLDRDELESSLSLTFGEKNLLITFHPSTYDIGCAAGQMRELLSALDEFRDTTLIFTMPNADPEFRDLSRMISAFTEKKPNAFLIASMGTLRYLSCMKFVDGIVGNSSSGLLEAPSFSIGTVNIGDRQRGRLRADSIIDCEAECEKIISSIKRLYEPSFKVILQRSANPYGDGGASRRIVDILKSYDFTKSLKKKFYDLPS
jgi:GDP/UDP-N,N'-diacetylbacillosamine 2-epimerase (hydrolysing)